MNLSFEDTQKKLDKALKRNLDTQAVAAVEPKTVEAKVDETQQITE